MWLCKEPLWMQVTFWDMRGGRGPAVFGGNGIQTDGLLKKLCLKTAVLQCFEYSSAKWLHTICPNPANALQIGFRTSGNTVGKLSTAVGIKQSNVSANFCEIESRSWHGLCKMGGTQILWRYGSVCTFTNYNARFYTFHCPKGHGHDNANHLWAASLVCRLL